MRLEFSAREDAAPLERIVDGLVFLSGGIWHLIERVGLAAEEHGFAGKVRLEVVTKDLLDMAVEPLAAEYSEGDLERASEIRHGRSVNASTWRGRTTSKWRRSMVAMSVTPRRSDAATIDASTAPSGTLR